MTSLQLPPRGFWIVCGLALIWNLMGIAAFVAQVTQSDEALATLPEAERDLYVNMPTWATAAFGLAVFAGALGCVLLLMRQASAIPALALSVTAIAVQMFHAFVLSPALEVLGVGGLVMPVLVTTIAIFLIWYARLARARSWIG